MHVKYTIVILVLTLNAISLFAQNCLPGFIRFETQGEIDSFPILYPGCTVIEGNVCIGDCQSPVISSNIRNLDGLAQLTSILGRLTISGNDSLTSLMGLGNLTVMEHDVEISGNASLTSLEGLDQIRIFKESFGIYNNPSIENITGFDMLDTVIGGLYIAGLNGLTSISAFTNVRYLGWYDVSDNHNLPTINDLENLEYLGGLYVDDNYFLTDLPAFPKLAVIDGDFLISNNLNLTRIGSYENIRRITGTVQISVQGPEHHRGPAPIQINGFHNLTYIGGSLSLVHIYGLDTLDAFTAVDSIGENLNVALDQVVHFFPHANHFSYIGGDINLEGIDNLQNLQCFSELEGIYGELFLRFCPNLTSLSGIDHLTEIGGELSLSLTGLPNLLELGNLTSIGGSLNIYDSDLLTDFSGLEGVTSIDGELFIFGNNNLETLEGIHNIDPQTFKPSGNFAMNLINNHKLSHCQIDNICEALQVLRKSYWIYGNDEGCASISQIDCEDFGLSGVVYYDINQNKLQDTNEVGLPAFNIRVDPEDEIVMTNVEGHYLVIADEGTEHTLRLEHGTNWILTTDSMQYTKVYQSGMPENSENHFGLFPAFEWHDLSLNLTSEPTRCNLNAKFYLHYLNEGTETENGRIVMQYDPRALFINSIIAPDSHDINQHELIWELDSLEAFHSGDIQLTFKIPNEIATGEYVHFTVSSFIDSSGTAIMKDQFTYSSLVLCSYDPNDKIVMPPGIEEENYTLKGELLTYTIRFENLGNAEAIDITIHDTLDAAFDMTTFKVINSSYPVFTTLDDHRVDFFFKNIWLRKNNRGFVTYEIKPLNDVDDFTPVENLARIVFDLNQPIRTNTTFNTLVEEICEDVAIVIDTVICRGENVFGYTETGIYFDSTHIGSICDSFTQINLTVLETEIIHIDTVICEGESFLGVDSTGLFTFEFINQVTGCTDIVELNLEVIPQGTGHCITGTRDAGSAAFLVYPNPAHLEFYVKASRSIESINLYSVDGLQVEFREKIEGMHATVKLDGGTPVGFYILVINVNGRPYFQKLLVCM